MKRAFFIASLAGLGVLLGDIPGVISGDTSRTIAAPDHSTHIENQRNGQSTGQFQRVQQPLANRVAITLGGLGLIGLELWWFLFSQPTSQRATTTAGIQEVTITVDGGYEPSEVVVQVGQPVRLKFNRQDPSSCLEEIRLPDFQIAQALPLHQVTAIEFTPTQSGTYTFTCGMNMFRGTIKVLPTALLQPSVNSASTASKASA
nr:MAG: cupredoxin domain-containing protein [Leptolyngbya sp. IPPAS B-1204]